MRVPLSFGKLILKDMTSLSENAIMLSDTIDERNK